MLTSMSVPRVRCVTVTRHRRQFTPPRRWFHSSLARFPPRLRCHYRHSLIDVLFVYSLQEDALDTRAQHTRALSLVRSNAGGGEKLIIAKRFFCGCVSSLITLKHKTEAKRFSSSQLQMDYSKRFVLIRLKHLKQTWNGCTLFADNKF